MKGPICVAVVCSALAFGSCASDSSSVLGPSSTSSDARSAASPATGVDTNEPGEPQPGAPEPGEGGAEQKVEGTVTNQTGACPNISFSIGPTRVTANQSTTYEGTSCAAVGQNGQSVEVKGTTQADGSLLAREIEVED